MYALDHYFAINQFFLSVYVKQMLGRGCCQRIQPLLLLLLFVPLLMGMRGKFWYRQYPRIFSLSDRTCKFNYPIIDPQTQRFSAEKRRKISKNQCFLLVPCELFRSKLWFIYNGEHL